MLRLTNCFQVICPQCGKRGMLIPKSHRVRHKYKEQCVTAFGKRFNVRHFIFCKVTKEWAQIQVDEEEKKAEEEFRRYGLYEERNGS